MGLKCPKISSHRLGHLGNTYPFSGRNYESDSKAQDFGVIRAEGNRIKLRSDNYKTYSRVILLFRLVTMQTTALGGTYK
jgi:hypothetical protein